MFLTNVVLIKQTIKWLTWAFFCIIRRRLSTSVSPISFALRSLQDKIPSIDSRSSRSTASRTRASTNDALTTWKLRLRKIKSNLLEHWVELTGPGGSFKWICWKIFWISLRLELVSKWETIVNYFSKLILIE
jgi:hypothetical protein